MPPYRWTSTEPKRHDQGTKEGATKDTKGTKDASLRSKNEGAHRAINLPTGTLRQEGHVLNADRWVTLPETVRGRRSRKTLTSLIITMKNQSIFHQSPCHEIAWPQ